MTFAQMQARAEILFEAIDSGNLPGFIEAEWLDLFNQAQEKLVLGILQDGISRNAFNKRVIDILVEDDNIAGGYSQAGTSPTFTITLTADTWWILNVTADVTLSTVTTTDILVDEISYDEYHANKNNPFKKPDKTERFWYYMVGSEMVVTTDTVTTLDELYITYARLPLTISTADAYSTHACELHTSVHSRIVEIAVQLAHKAVEDEKGFQLQVLENQNPSIP